MPPLRRKRAVAHDVEAQFSTVVTPALGAGHPVDRVHRSSVPGGNPRFSPKISEVKATDQQRPAQAPIGLYKTEIIRRRGPWRNLEAVEFATLEWVEWFNNRRLLAPIGNVPPTECEQQYYLAQKAPVMTAGVN